MASLVPNFTYTPNTTAASNAYITAMNNFNESLMAPVNFLDKVNRDALAEKERKEAKAIRDEDRAWKLEDRKIAQAERDRILSKETATNEALRAVLDPKAYQQEKMSEEQQAIKSGLMNLSPEDRAIAEQQLKDTYNKNVSSSQWLANVLGNVNADQSKILSMKKNAYDLASSTPGTPEYEAKVAADRAEKKWAIDLQIAKQKEMEASREAKEKRALEGLLAGLQTGKTYLKEEVSETNVPEIEARKKVNADLDKKATEYGLKYKDLIEQDTTLADLNNAISRFENIAKEDYSAGGMFGGEDTPLGKSAAKGLEDLLKRRDARIADLDKLARSNVGIGNASDVYRREEIPQLFEEKVEVEVPKTKEEWTNAAIANAGPNITTSALSAILTRAESMYPKADPKEVIKAREKDQQVKDYKKLIQTITGKPTDLNTIEALEAQYKTLTTNKSTADKGVGPLSISTMLSLGLSDSDIEEITNKAKEKKISDDDLAKALKTIDDSTWTDSGTAADIKALLDSLESRTNK